MPNLLPEQSKKKNKLEYRLRLVVVVLTFLLLGSIIGLAFLVPSYVLLSEEYGNKVKQRDVITQTIEASKGNVTSTALDSTASKLAVLRQGGETSSLLGLVTKITNHLVSGVRINHIVYSATQSSSQLTLGGIASTRETLIGFKNSIQTEPSFTNVSHSIADLVKASNVNFTLNIVGSF